MKAIVILCLSLLVVSASASFPHARLQRALEEVDNAEHELTARGIPEYRKPVQRSEPVFRNLRAIVKRSACVDTCVTTYNQCKDANESFCLTDFNKCSGKC